MKCRWLEAFCYCFFLKFLLPLRVSLHAKFCDVIFTLYVRFEKGFGFHEAAGFFFVLSLKDVFMVTSALFVGEFRKWTSEAMLVPLCGHCGLPGAFTSSEATPILSPCKYLFGPLVW